MTVHSSFRFIKKTSVYRCLCTNSLNLDTLTPRYSLIIGKLFKWAVDISIPQMPDSNL